jgi:hypothetical protein
MNPLTIPPKVDDLSLAQLRENLIDIEHARLRIVTPAVNYQLALAS